MVSLPEKENVTLPTNHYNAENRFESLETCLGNNANLRHVYYTHMLDYMQRGQVELRDQDEKQEGTFYLPHHAVSRGKGGGTKWRILFDASSHESGVSSLNDALELGPKLLPELFVILLSFRLNLVAIIGDIHQAFLQLHLDVKDRDLTRFFWYRVMRDEEGNCNTTDEVI